MKHAHSTRSTVDQVASELDVCDILDLCTQEHKFLGVSIEPFSYCFTCNMSLIKAVVLCIFADIASYSPGKEHPKAIRASHAVLPD
ncbi:hypothetical protein BH10CYA1_BH10CYA1_24590 [soil metagenome]